MKLLQKVIVLTILVSSWAILASSQPLHGVFQVKKIEPSGSDRLVSFEEVVSKKEVRILTSNLHVEITSGSSFEMYVELKPNQNIEAHQILVLFKNRNFIRPVWILSKQQSTVDLSSSIPYLKMHLPDFSVY